VNDAFAFDKRQLRRSFEKAARSYDSAAVLQREVCDRLLERLPLLKIDPERILDAGSGTGYAVPGLRRQFPRASVIELDLAVSMLLAARAKVAWWRRVLGAAGGRPQVCGDLEHLPLQAASIDLVWSNLTLQWSNDLQAWLGECFRVLRPGGVLAFSSFGPDTLKELRAAFAAVDRAVHVNRFVDMHDVGDCLVQTGFAEPVVDMELVTLSYRELGDLMRDLKAIGAHNVNAGRPRGLAGRALFRRVAEEYERWRDARHGLPATFEVLYGVAWKPQPRTGPSGRPVIDIRPAI
jgi:malonyl-CoA O-methyltransferase